MKVIFLWLNGPFERKDVTFPSADIVVLGPKGEGCLEVPGFSEGVLGTLELERKRCYLGVEFAAVDVLVNGVRVLPGQRAEIKHKTSIQFGQKGPTARVGFESEPADFLLAGAEAAVEIRARESAGTKASMLIRTSRMSRLSCLGRLLVLIVLVALVVLGIFWIRSCSRKKKEMRQGSFPVFFYAAKPGFSSLRTARTLADRPSHLLMRSLSASRQSLCQFT